MKINDLGPNTILFIDLDDSLLKGDLLKEQIIQLVLTKPHKALGLIVHFFGGRLKLKSFVAEQMPVDPSSLSYRQSVLDLAQSAKSFGSKIVLASASPHAWVAAIASHLDVFDDCIASKDKNLKGLEKLKAMQTYSNQSFAYVGDSTVDHPIWEASQIAVAVNPKSETKTYLNQLQQSGKIKQWLEIRDRKPLYRTILKAIRPHQWAKNALITLPFIATHAIPTVSTLSSLILGLISFSMIASSVYVFNDLMDRHADRKHPSKKNRPIASGDLTLPSAIVLQISLISLAFLSSWLINGSFILVILAYLILNLAYTFRLKKVPMLDVVVLSGMYTIRIIAGGEATDTPVSHWLLIFSTFFFMGLAIVKRYVEVSTLVDKASTKNNFGRGYLHDDAPVLLGMGMSCSFLSILVIALYLNSSQVLSLYQHSDRLWWMVPLLVYWSGRMWLLASRRLVQDDPVAFALKDRTSWIIGLIAMAVLKLAV
jgi:4-hydroxybenzoate polyprenyltransferase/phosphoserine phosphatase